MWFRVQNKIGVLLIGAIFLGTLGFSTVLAQINSNEISQEVFLRNLRQGDRNDDVLKLQKILNLTPETRLAQSGPGAPGEETNYFGPLTFAAVVKFQEKHATDILFPIQLTRGTGFVGPMTRKKLNETNNIVINSTDSSITTINRSDTSGISGSSNSGTQKNQTNVIQPKIFSLTPNSGVNGTTITINGEGFTPNGNTIRTTLAIFENATSTDGKTINFNLYSETVKDLVGLDLLLKDGMTPQELAINIEQVRINHPENAFPKDMSFNFPLYISVANINGASEPAKFELNMDPMLSLVNATNKIAENKPLFKKIINFAWMFGTKIANARCDWSCHYNNWQSESNRVWDNFVSQGGGDIGPGPAFGGNVIVALPCVCSLNTAFVQRPVSGKTGPYVVSWVTGALKANYAIFPGNWVLGSGLPEGSGICSIATPAGCFQKNASEILPLPGVGTSLGV